MEEEKGNWRYFELDPEKDRNLINIINPNDPGSEYIILNIGTHTIKYGLASQLSPFVVPNLIAYRSEKAKVFDSRTMSSDVDMEE